MKKNKLINTLLLAVLAVVMASCTAGNVDEGYVEPKESWDDYEGNIEDVILKTEVSGFEVYVLEDITTHSKLGQPAYNQFLEDLGKLNELLPSSVLGQLKNHPIHVINVVGDDILYYDDNPSSEYYNSIVINDIGVYYNVVTRNQPMLLMHYFARIYWDNYLTASQKSAIETAYESNKSKYTSVYRSNGLKLQVEKVESPATESALMYFCENTEAYFDGNDYYPFDYEELEFHDPQGHAAMEGVWGARAIEPNPYGVMYTAGLMVGTRSRPTQIDEWHRKYIVANCNGYDYYIVGSRFVGDSCFVQAKNIIEAMSINKEGTTYMEQAMYWNNYYRYYIGIVAKNESNSEVPECRGWASDSAYGYGSTTTSPMLMIVESDICGPGIGGVKLGQSILSHEFGHNLEDGLGFAVPGFTAELEALYNEVVVNQEKYTGTYAATNYKEYWAEATSAWYNAGSQGMYVTYETGDIENGEPVTARRAIVTREDLRDYDPGMYELMSRYYPDHVKLTGFHFDW